uniref:Toll-like receptor 9 n=2 Tax=Paramormyrops kingsleyae TaxID=1676925 RepID=A0A3B3R549_9TELE|nr:toll-like receptor 9 isoform X1 [Paramormyrops kingsleyae]
MVISWKNLFLLYLCNWLTAVRSRNPFFFPCENDTLSTILDCQKRGLTNVPTIKSVSVLSINLEGNKIQTVKSNALAGVPNLQNFSIMWNCPPGKLKGPGTRSCKLDIAPDAFVHLKNLSHLFLGGNSLLSIPRLPGGLKVLGLESSNIYRINTPLGTPQLKMLLLFKNCYYRNPCNQTFYINESVWQELRELTNLTLGFNNITAVPKGLPQNLTSLDLRENKISHIDEIAFANLTRLTYLNLEWNCQRCDHAAQPCFPCSNNSAINLHPKAFQNLSKITHLILRGNSLKDLPEGLFQGLQRLTYLDLSDNLLAYSIRNDSFFRDLKKVKLLNLIYNYEPLKTFDGLILSPYFSEMTSLEELLISGYFFHKLTTQSLSPLRNLPKLQNLDLRMNFINECQLSIFSNITSLKKVVLSQNILEFPYCSPNTNQFTFQNQNRLTDKVIITPEALNSEGQYLESNEKYYQSMLDFQKQYCRGKLFFDLSQNNILTLQENIFQGMDTVVCLDLSLNYLSQSLNGKQFQHLSNLEYLNMAHNRIDMYYDGAFKELRKTLKVLDLSSNEFHFRMKGMGHRFEFIENLTSLKVLSLSQNSIGIRISVALQSSSLRYLFFSGNHLDIMWDMAGDQYLRFFQNLTNLAYLDISRNHLKSFKPEAFCNLPKTLEVLKVNNNKLIYFPWHNLTVLNQLRCLNISGNFLSELPNQPIKFGHNLTVLDLSYNQIRWLPESFFHEASSLMCLLLNHNKLKFLNAQCFPSPLTVSLHKLTLHDNPFMCSCDTSWLMDFLVSSTIQIPYLTTGIRCGFPESQNEKLVLSMDSRSCQEIYGSVGFIITSFLTIIFTLVPLLKKLYGWDLWYGIQIFWAQHKGYSQLLGKQGQHDAFIVFDTLNAAVTDWVYNELIVNLENQGRQRFSLCLEERDWVPGISCIENLHNAVYSSKKTVFVLTSTGSVSGIARQAFIMVQQRLLDEKIDTIVLVLLDEVFPKSKYLQMRKMLCRKSVLSWPRNPRAHQHFWNNMRATLASDNCRSYNCHISESLLSNGLI